MPKRQFGFHSIAMELKQPTASPSRHEMNLWHAPFLAIKEGRKTVEMRLNDERRSKIKVGDLILFKEKDSGEEILAEVVELRAFKDFYELYPRYSKQEIGYRDDEIADPKDMLLYYTEDAIAKWGALAIRIKTL